MSPSGTALSPLTLTLSPQGERELQPTYRKHKLLNPDILIRYESSHMKFKNE